MTDVQTIAVRYTGFSVAALTRTKILTMVKLKYKIFGFDQYGMFVACGIWCLADVSSISPSSEQTV